MTLNFGMSIGIEERNTANEYVFGKKSSHLGKRAILFPKVVHPHYPGSDLNFFLNFAQRKGPIGR